MRGLLDHMIGAPINEETGRRIHALVDELMQGKPQFHPSRDWAQGGPIIEREGITLLDPKFCESGQWEAFMGAFPDVRKYSIVGMVAQGAGPTPLIAAMRAYVASKFGDEVPDIEKPL